MGQVNDSFLCVAGVESWEVSAKRQPFASGDLRGLRSGGRDRVPSAGRAAC